MWFGLELHLFTEECGSLGLGGCEGFGVITSILHEYEYTQYMQPVKQCFVALFYDAAIAGPPSSTYL